MTSPAPLPAVGASFQLTRGVLPWLQLVKADDGSDTERVLIDPDASGVSVAESSISGGTRYTFSGSVATTNHGTLTVNVTMDATGSQAEGWDITVTSSSTPSASAVESIGIALELAAQSNVVHTLMSPVFSGVTWEDPHTVMTQAHDTNVSASMQVCCYWSDDGTGLVIHGLDSTGYKPKHFRFEPVNDDADLRMVAATWLPNAHLGGQSATMLHSYRIRPYHWDTARETGWRPAAQLYRRYLESFIVEGGVDHILERGRLEDRSDVATWLKELELMVTDTASWYPGQAQVSDPFEALTTHQTELECSNILLALWAASDPSTDEGKVGTWAPKVGLRSQMATLASAGIRTSVYTWPHAFDVANPDLSGVSAYRVQGRDGVDVTEAGDSGETYAVMDVAEPGLATYYSQLAASHVENYGTNGFYTDLPVTAGQPDFDRSSGLELGRSKDGYEGMANIHESMLSGASNDFAIFHEACFEWLVRSATLGQGAISTYLRVVPGESKTSSVPFFQEVFSGYCAFWPADPALGTQTLANVPTAYGPFTEHNISRLQAEGVVLGGIPNVSEVYLPEGLMSYEKSVSEQVDAWLAQHKETMISAINLRQAARDHLVYGQLLGDPRSGGDETSMTLNVYYQSLAATLAETFTKPDVHTKAWRAADGSTRIVAMNGTSSEGDVEIDMAAVGMPQVRELRDVTSGERFAVRNATAPARGARFDVTVDTASYRILEAV